MSKRKPHNIHKRHAAYARALLKRLNAVVIWVAGQHDSKCILVSLKTGDMIPIGAELQGAIANVAHDWTVYCAAMGRRQDGEEYMKGAQVHAPRCYQFQIADQLNDVHMDIIRDMNPNHRCGAGWIACPFSADISEEQAGMLFDKHGGWALERLELKDVA